MTILLLVLVLVVFIVIVVLAALRGAGFADRRAEEMRRSRR